MKRKLMSILLTVGMLISILPLSMFGAFASEVIASGSFSIYGGDINWKFDDEGTLTISGEGKMKDFNDGDNKAPWYNDYCTSIEKVVIEEGVTSIGNYAFLGCTNLVTINIGTGITKIGESAFKETAYYENSSNWENDVLYAGDCLIEAKTSLIGKYTVKDGTKAIADKAFYNCGYLTGIIIPDSVKAIGNSAFENCSGLGNIKIGNGVKSIGSNAFKNCHSKEILLPKEDLAIREDEQDDFRMVTFVGGKNGKVVIKKVLFKNDRVTVPTKEEVRAAGRGFFKFYTGRWLDQYGYTYTNESLRYFYGNVQVLHAEYLGLFKYIWFLITED